MFSEIGSFCFEISEKNVLKCGLPKECLQKFLEHGTCCSFAGISSDGNVPFTFVGYVFTHFEDYEDENDIANDHNQLNEYDDEDYGSYEKSHYTIVSNYVIEMCRKASVKGHFECFKFALENGMPKMFSSLEIPFVMNKPSKEFEKVRSFWDCAAERGDLKILSYAYENGFSLTSQGLMLAAKNNRLDVLKLVQEKGGSLKEPFIWKVAAENGHLDIVQFGFENGFWKTGEKLCFEIQRKFLTLVDKSSLTVDFWKSVGKSDNVQLIEFAHNNGFVLTDDVWVAAAKFGFGKCLRFAHDNKYVLGKNIWTAAVCSGNLYSISFALNNGYKIMCQICHESEPVTSEDVKRTKFEKFQQAIAFCHENVSFKSKCFCHALRSHVGMKDHPSI